ncbi:2-oxoacid:acceptor oxidoreductase family protein [Orenia marismortui]|uniref:Pyruvate ferredoxin oxidoreductase gamma subunit n=1 Tax=Orenia marismortui TaxID=46469 RepID=A0A4V3GY96_9FIRM|nr:2-oxoacid:acceptor oxidoreductase family protein [Orenia marismortui]TDX51314.1 pyruvate ferredoxin oxidoreductase gamma subunit [Orenia marismortui]
MSDLIEIRWHGRGGQGSKTASILLGKVAAKTGKNIQAFPEYGPERMGAPVLAYNRISDKEITVHCQVTEPDIVAVLDPTLLDVVDVTEGVPDNGIVIINTEIAASKLKDKIEFKGELYTVDAYGISTEEIGAPFPNTPMLGALIKTTDLLDFEGFVSEMKNEFKKKFAHKPEVIEGNINSMKRAYQEVKS